jgi:membrane protease YdiL (CAAX protease family)
MGPFAPREPGQRPAPSGSGPGLSQGELLGLFFLTLVGNTFVQIMVYGALERIFLAAVAGAVLGVFLPLWLLMRFRKLKPSQELGLDRPPLIILAVTAALALAAMTPASLLAELSVRLSPADPQAVLRYNENIPTGFLPRALVFVAVAGITPLAEELMYRALLHRFASRMWGPLRAAAVSSVLFGVLHFQPWLVFGLIGIGLVLAFVYETTGSVTACWVAHALHNGVTMGVMFHRGGVSYEPNALVLSHLLWAAGSLVAMVLLGAYLMNHRRTRLQAAGRG